MIYICIEAFATEGGEEYTKNSLIGEDAYVFLQPSERENFVEYDEDEKVIDHDDKN